MIPTLLHYPSLTRAIQINTTVRNPERVATNLLRHFGEFSASANYVVLFIKLGTGPLETRPWTLRLVGPNMEYRTLADIEQSFTQVSGPDAYVPVGFVELKHNGHLVEA
jgi:hypothetical protein